MTPEEAKKILDELHELSPEPLFNGKEYFDCEELKQEQEYERYKKCEVMTSTETQNLFRKAK